ncbi:ROK family transcriptional regulator [Microbacterium gorillae]|uniref:ROK family transcriptional regulator n=1 Tax=Microbacterium gorillae TaxID=1231063 RepID=UPI00058E3684|nr:ROK family transcriptional regulator [Microbacterium gorillae]
MSQQSSSPASRNAASTDVVARVNRTKLIELLREAGPLTRQQIAERTALSATTVIRLTTTLTAARTIEVAGSATSGGGRPAQLYRYVGESRCSAVVQVHADRVAGALVNMGGEVIFRRSSRYRSETGAGASPAADQWTVIRSLVRSLIHEAENMSVPAVAIGVAVPGPVNTAGVTLPMTQIGWAGMDLGELLRAEFALPAAVENDANALAVGEHSRGCGADDMVAMIVQEGVGAGIVTNGRLHRGSRFEAGEVGYLLVGQGALSGPAGRRGELESQLSPEYLAHQLDRHDARPRADETASVPYVLGRASAGEAAAMAVAEDVLDLLAVATAALVSVLDPEVVVLGEGFAPLDFTIPELEARLRDRVMAPPRIVPATFGDDGVFVGMAELAASNENRFAYLAY